MPRVLLIYWNAAEAAERADGLRREDFEVEAFSGPGGDAFRALADNPPAAILIDLARLPSHGNAVGIAFRQRKATRSVPLVFIEGHPEKTARTRALLPDAVFTTWPKAVAGCAAPCANAPAAARAGHFCRVLRDAAGQEAAHPRELRVALHRAPEGFEAKLEPLPEGVRFVRKTREADVILAFATSSATLGRALPPLAAEMRDGRTLWIVWPKKLRRWPGTAPSRGSGKSD